ncbi:S1C family serine protease [Sphingomonas carotinifaciens]|uniref:Trypsin-like peptidase domain-containing protein n=1 Tax=Sphingomonas carotinifaciens TaxID=1166323 RepID=A0A1G7KPN3_9SPHN|nr:trypsin-like peptidase domain-containing protein [Sphingomonas carotinifaciens]MBB4085354.1 V8-like Glu-specific endopeptidase [Sphingomonas carotinifaciens]SDF39135.1 Trypsin-like peptidase domain-containing protein [Sphingomonas carotinifaciens]
MIVRLALAFVFLVGLAVPARADDIAAAARGVVRVVTIAVVDDQVAGFGHGSGFAVAPNRIVTNAHVVELAERYPDNVVVGIVPSEGSKSYQGRVVAYDARRDLALIEITEARLPPVALYTGPVAEGNAVIALGYPGNVDLATAQSAADYIRPLSPVRSQGVASGRRSLTGIEVLLHTASIARGNSGGPLLDPCGRVIGVNSALTRADEGDSTFGFAIADTELMGFLRDAQQPYVSAGGPCTSIEERLREDSAADARATEDAAAARREAAGAAALKRQAALDHARDEAERTRENVMALAGLLLVAGALGIGAAGLFESRGQRRAAIWAVSGGGLGVLAAVVVFVARPSGEPELPADTVAPTTMPIRDAAIGRLVCTLQPERSRVTMSSTAEVTLEWGRAGCMNGTQQFAEGDARWERIAVPDEEQTVSVQRFDPLTRTYADTRYFLSAAGMAAARAARGDKPVSGCSAADAVQDALARQQAAIRATLPPLPNEKLVYSCRKAG